MARSLRSYIVEERGHPKDWVKASGYWQRGHAASNGPDAHVEIGD